MRALIAITCLLLVGLFSSGAVSSAQAQTCGIFVTTNGTDSSTSGLDPSDPCLSINHGITRAVEEGLSCVFVQAGIYNEIVVMQDGVNVEGGYDTNWWKSDYASPGHEVVIQGGIDGATGLAVGVKAYGLTLPTTLSNLQIVAPDAVGNFGGRGNSSVGIHVLDSANLLLSDLRVEAGKGAAGADGNAGMEMPQSPDASMNGKPGAPGLEQITTCNTTRSPGGAGGTNPLVEPRFAGGAGGAGGGMDTYCGFPPNYNAGDGIDGRATIAGDGWGWGGSGGSASACGGGQPGLNGLDGGAGRGGAGGTEGGHIINGAWYARSGLRGTAGNPGTGGGGGGGAAGCDTGTDERGGGGGGGGAGGTPSLGGGYGGGGGGGSFAVLAVSSNLVVQSSELLHGVAGGGGEGGSSGLGQPGGFGGIGGASGGQSGNGGQGGRGGAGGESGAGGGGAGGDSWGIHGIASTVETLDLSYSPPTPAAPGGVGGTANFTFSTGKNGVDGQSGNIKVELPAKLTAPLPLPDCYVYDCQVTSVDDRPARVLAFGLQNNVPNPFNPSTEIRFTLAARGPASIEVYNLAGRRVRTLAADQIFDAGTNQVMWRGRDDAGRGVPSGTYMVLLRAEGQTASKKVMLVK